MRKILSTLIILMCSIQMWGQTLVDGIYYSFSGEEATVVRGNVEYTGEVVIPNIVYCNGDSFLVKHVSFNVFYNCTNLTSLVVNAESIDALYHCPKLTSVSFGSSLLFIESEDTIFIHFCPNLICFNIDENNPNYSSIDGVLFNKEKTKLIQYPAGKKGDYTIPSSVTNISNSAFHGCDSLTSITIPKSVISIENGAFSDCSNLDTVKVYWEEPLYLQSFYPFCWVNPSSIVLSVPKGTKTAYQNANVWKEFNIVERESILEDNITIVLQDTMATITWQPVLNANSYTLVIYGDIGLSQPIITVYFDGNGIIILILRSSSGEVYSYTVGELLNGTDYYYELSAIGADDEVIDKTQGSFTTRSNNTTDVVETGVRECRIYTEKQFITIVNAENQPVKIIDVTGKILVNKTVTSLVDQFYMTNKGVYIVLVGGKVQKVLVQ